MYGSAGKCCWTIMFVGFIIQIGNSFETHCPHDFYSNIMGKMVRVSSARGHLKPPSCGGFFIYTPVCSGIRIFKPESLFYLGVTGATLMQPA